MPDNNCDEDVLEIIDYYKTQSNIPISVMKQEFNYNQVNGEYIFLCNSKDWLSMVA